MRLAEPKRLSTHKCRHGRAVIEKRRTDPDAEFLGGSNRSEGSPENRYRGSRTAVAMIAAEVLGLEVDEVRPMVADTDAICPHGSDWREQDDVCLPGLHA
jgi:hypothetical protein